MDHGLLSAMWGSQDLYIDWPQLTGRLWKEVKDPERLQYLDICSLAKYKGWWHVAIQALYPRT